MVGYDEERMGSIIVQAEEKRKYFFIYQMLK